MQYLRKLSGRINSTLIIISRVEARNINFLVKSLYVDLKSGICKFKSWAVDMGRRNHLGWSSPAGGRGDGQRLSALQGPRDTIHALRFYSDIIGREINLSGGR